MDLESEIPKYEEIPIIQELLRAVVKLQKDVEVLKHRKIPTQLQDIVFKAGGTPQ